MGDVSTETAKQPARSKARNIKPGEAIGRNGEVLRRGRNYEDQFAIPEHLKEEGWSYQWNRKSTYGKEDRAEMIRMQDNGWRPVPASRFGFEEDGEFIERDGLVLMERPSALTKEAEDEEYRKAMEQYAHSFDRVDSDASLPEMARTMRKQIRRERRLTIKPENANAGSSIPDDE